MTTTPTPAEFLTQQEPDEPDEESSPAEFLELSDPLTSMAYSLKAIERHFGKREAEEQADNELRQLYDSLDQSYADLEAKYEAVSRLVDDVLEVCKPSVSKLAIQVRETVDKWRAPIIQEPKIVAVAPSIANHPAHDAGVEEWAVYAESLGYDVPGSMNRSQIRTMLGIAHVDEPS